MTVLSVCVGEEDFEGIGWDELPKTMRIKKALKEGLRAGVVPAANRQDSDVQMTIKVPLSGNDEQQLRMLSVDEKEFPTIQDKAGGVVRAFARHHQSQALEESGESLIVKPRREQRKMCRLMAGSDERNSILFLEASTGVGKGRALCAHSAHLVNSGRSKRVVISAPTIAILGQLYEEYQSLDAGRPASASTIGMHEFVSEVALRKILDEPESNELPNVEDARRWLHKEGRVPWGPLQKRWLCASLEAVAPEFPMAEVRLRPHLKAILNEEDDAGLRAYEGCNRLAEKAQVVFCTHAKLAGDVVKRLIATRDKGIPYADRDKWESPESWWHADLSMRADAKAEGLLPTYDAVMVDEAHLLERSFDQATSDQISLFSLKLLVAEHGSPALKTIFNNGFQKLTKLGRQHSWIDVGAHGDAGADTSAVLKSMVRALKRHEKKIKNKNARGVIQDFMRRMHWIERCGDSDNHFITHVYFTPSRRYPLIERSKRNVNRELTFLWKGVRSAVLSSATLYLPTEGGLLMHDIRKELRVPVERAEAMSPICPSWVTGPVTVHLPPGSADKGSQEGLLVPPRADANDVEWKTYFDRMASFVLSTFRERRSGGALFLMTSYEAISELQKRLEVSELSSRCIASQRGESFEKTKTEYLRRVQMGEAPIWLTTGRAWTGLDLSVGKTAKADNAIDYLVIPRLPVMMNISNIYRQYLLDENGGRRFGAREIWYCARYLRQGLGRAVRRRGVKKKEIFVLDGRLCRSVRSRLTRLRALFADYQHVRTLRIE